MTGYDGDHCVACAADYKMTENKTCALNHCKDNCNAALGGGNCTLNDKQFECNCAQNYTDADCKKCSDGYKLHVTGKCFKDNCIDVNISCSGHGDC